MGLFFILIRTYALKRVLRVPALQLPEFLNAYFIIYMKLKSRKKFYPSIFDFFK